MILIVDDTVENIFSLKTLLELHSFPVDTASDGEEALRKVLKRTYALIILDVQMPGMDGFEVAETLAGSSSTKDIPIIFLSAVNIEKKYITKGYLSGGIDYVTKPIDPDILLLKVKTFYRIYEQNRILNEMQDSLIREIAVRKEAQMEAQDASRRKDEFMSIAGHELKTPLASIKAYMQLLDRSLEMEDQKKPYVERSLVQINKLNNLITDLLDSSKIDGGQLRFNENVFDFEDPLEEACDMIRHTFPKHRITRTGSRHVFVKGDEMRLGQVFVNFLTNAAKYSPDTADIYIHSALEDGRLIFSVRDKGIGIPAENIADVFKKFYRVEGAATRFQGLGVGLYICAEIIGRHHGRCWVESEQGKGSTFFFSIPTATAQP